MSGGDKADIMASARLEFEHHLGEPFVRDLISFLLFPSLRDLMILAVDAAEIAVAEEDVAGAAGAGEARFFAKMCGVARYNRQTAGVARGYLAGDAVIAAIFRAHGAGTEKLLERFNSRAERLRLQERLMLWNEIVVCHERCRCIFQ